MKIKDSRYEAFVWPAFKIEKMTPNINILTPGKRDFTFSTILRMQRNKIFYLVPVQYSMSFTGSLRKMTVHEEMIPHAIKHLEKIFDKFIVTPEDDKIFLDKFQDFE